MCITCIKNLLVYSFINFLTWYIFLNFPWLRLWILICGTHWKVYSFDQIRSEEYLGQVFRLWLKWDLAPDRGMGSGGGGKCAAKLKHSFGTGKEGEQMVAPHLSCEGVTLDALCMYLGSWLCVAHNYLWIWQSSQDKASAVDSNAFGSILCTVPQGK